MCLQLFADTFCVLLRWSLYIHKLTYSTAAPGLSSAHVENTSIIIFVLTYYLQQQQHVAAWQSPSNLVNNWWSTTNLRNHLKIQPLADFVDPQCSS
jgi:hypothetical protein